MLLKVLLVDDEHLARARLRSLLADCNEPVTVVGEAAHAVQAMEALRRGGCDVVLLDIHMPGADGMALAAALRELPAPPLVVFVTAHVEHAVRAFELEAVDYLTKPVRRERLQQALQKARRLLQPPVVSVAPEPASAADCLLIQDRGRTERVPLREVLYLKAELKYITVRTASKEHILDGTLNELEERYRTWLVRIHRNALVARRAVRALEKHHHPQDGEGWVVRLDGLDERLAVSRRQLAAVREVLGA